MLFPNQEVKLFFQTREKLTNFQFSPIGERELSQSSFSSPLSSFITSPQSVKPLYCSPNELWHLRFGHVSTTTLHKLPYIKSSHNSTRCVVCIRAKRSRKSFYHSRQERRSVPMLEIAGF